MSRSSHVFRPSVALSLSLALALGAQAPAAYAEEKYNVWVGATQVTSTNKNDVKSDGTVSYDPETGTLTLKNAKISESSRAESRAKEENREDATVGIYAIDEGENSKSLILNLQGKNSIHVPASDLDVYGLKYVGKSQSPLKIVGQGELNVTTADSAKGTYGIQSTVQLIVDGPTLNFKPGRSLQLSSTGMSLFKGLKMQAGEIVAEANTGKHSSVGIFNAFENIEITGGKVTASGKLHDHHLGQTNYGLYAFGKLTVKDAEVEVLSPNKAMHVVEYATGSLPVKVNTTPSADGATGWDQTTSLKEDGPYKFVKIGPRTQMLHEGNQGNNAQGNGTTVPPVAEVPDAPKEQGKPDADIEKRKENTPKPEADATQPDNGTVPDDQSNNNSPRGWVKALLGVLGSLGVVGILAAVISALNPQHIIPPALRNLLRV
ncbi:hypothetical protein P4N68_03875 [Corynebacterium felinum]|uniref:Uncharacterized protein n=1 Tax=Corynebacterium felinum TaxID=131318 RepID=A0ABU2B8D1_9CORY|nr:hypothetical protein [Corynebacterium felinum]MDF5820223.1 hypothetical protein [Corynebacterium felinum]MDR7354863.1 hypothetical protein [Corynebacterium felinum]WJY94223.1 hypothetical protein CFELI_02905 [Corynebacterium felinum]